jgi:hypothetical protein
MYGPARLEPTVKHLFNTFQGTFPIFRRDSYVVNFFPVDVGDVLDTR